MIKCAFYGSLRKGLYNYKRFRQIYGDGIVYKKTIKLPGFRLYDLGYYPAAIRVHTKFTDDEITVDLMEIAQECYYNIQNMELNAGYNIDTVLIEEEKHCIFTFYLDQVNHLQKIEGGDWFKYSMEKHINL